MNPRWILRTGRLVMTPVGGADLADLVAFKADPRVFAVMLGGVRSSTETAEDLARDVAGWGADGFGIWAVREPPHIAWDPRAGRGPAGPFVGIAGLQRRDDGRGVALRFALEAEAQGRGLAREAAGAALRFGHDEVGLSRIVAVARENNYASRTVLGSIGMTECDSFMRDGWQMLVYESVRR
jgi:RimJ/RimL family protein N-acetyltransferase